ncbi:MAG: glycosyltransferase [bacterium]|nr:glycosyltransferase [bacterium]
MRIHYTATIWHGGFYQFIGNALKSLGHEVVFFNDGGTKQQALFERFATRIPKLTYRAEDTFRRSVSRDWLKSVREANPDLILLQHVPNILPEVLREARELKKPIFYWMDSPAAGAQAKDVLACMPYVDKIFTIDRSHFWMTTLHGENDTIFLPLAGDAETFHPLTPAPKKEYDVVFVGSLPPQSGDGYIRAKIMADISEKYKVGVFGTGIDYWYKYFPSLASRAKSGKLSFAAMNELYNKSKILLNIHSTYHIDSASARTFEAALSCVFQLVDHRADHDELFPKNSLAYFNSAKEIAPLLDRWLAPSADAERAQMASRAREHVLQHHTWKHRVVELLKYFK